jgi:hypothetical protein
MKLLVIGILSFWCMMAPAQSLLEMIGTEKNDTNYVEATFKATRLINGQTTETTGKKELNVIISHRFGKINEGVYSLYGLDESTIRLGMEYGLTDNIDIGVGRSSFQKLVDGYTKIKILRQCSGAIRHPVSVTYYGSMQVKTEKWISTDLDYPFTARLFYSHEIMIARKFNSSFSSLLVPGFVHRNMVPTSDDKNVIPYTGVGARLKLTQRMAVCAEYYYVFGNNGKYTNPLSCGLEIETGGHVFQLVFSNGEGINEKLFIPETAGKWKSGDIHFGFNLIRHFNFNK